MFFINPLIIWLSGKKWKKFQLSINDIWLSDKIDGNIYGKREIPLH